MVELGQGRDEFLEGRVVMGIAHNTYQVLLFLDARYAAISIDFGRSMDGLHSGDPCDRVDFDQELFIGEI